jgi:hypothetical protein
MGWARSVAYPEGETTKGLVALFAGKRGGGRIDPRRTATTIRLTGEAPGEPLAPWLLPQLGTPSETEGQLVFGAVDAVDFARERLSMMRAGERYSKIGRGVSKRAEYGAVEMKAASGSAHLCSPFLIVAGEVIVVTAP